MTEPSRIEVVVGDITRLRADAIVNAANASLLGGGGVDGAVHRAAGPRLRAHNEGLGGCPTGMAVLTPAFDLEARGVRHLIHTVGPVWRAAPTTPLGQAAEDAQLASCYVECLRIATELSLESLAFPGISTGAYGFPKARAARIAAGHVSDWLARHAAPARVLLCAFTELDAEIQRAALRPYVPPAGRERDAWADEAGPGA